MTNREWILAKLAKMPDEELEKFYTDGCYPHEIESICGYCERMGRKCSDPCATDATEWLDSEVVKK